MNYTVVVDTFSNFLSCDQLVVVYVSGIKMCVCVAVNGIFFMCVCQ